MTITVWREGEHPAGFCGIRVSGTLPCGSRVQEYWNFRKKVQGSPTYKMISESAQKKMMREAKTLDAELQKRRPLKSTQSPHGNIYPARETTVARLRLFIECKNHRNSRRLPVHGEPFEWDYGYPAFLSSPYAGNRLGKGQRRFLISKYGYRGAWEAAVKYWASGDDEASKDRLELTLAEIPHPKQFIKLYWQMVLENSVPPHSLLKEFRALAREFKR